MGLVKRRIDCLPIFDDTNISPVSFPSKTGLTPGLSAFACLSVSIFSAHHWAHQEVLKSVGLHKSNLDGFIIQALELKRIFYVALCLFGVEYGCLHLRQY